MNHAPTSPQQKYDSGKLALIIVLASETFFFATLISTYMFIRGNETSWPAVQLSAARMAVPLANTVILLLSALTVYLGYRAIRRGDQSSLVWWFALSLVLGLVFVGGQALEYTGQGMLPGQMSGGVFLTLMGFHALHMFAGVLILAIALARARQGDFSARRYTGVELSAWFWYYVVAVWFVLFIALYLI
jgi:cytochrome c oxidase subunit III